MHVVACGRRCYCGSASTKRRCGGLGVLRIGFRPARLRGGPSACRPLAEKGDVRAQTSLGGKYYNGQGVRRDYAEATKWVRKAAGRGYAPAQAYLGIMYWNGQDVPRDPVLAYMC